MCNQKRMFAVFITLLGSSMIILGHWFLQTNLLVTNTPRNATVAKLAHDNETRKYKLLVTDTPRHATVAKLAHDDLKLVLVYTPWFGQSPWPFAPNDYNFAECGVQTCKVSYNKNDLGKSDAVIFHGRDLPSATDMKNILKQKPPQQRWIYFILESPKNTFGDLSHYNGFFNWTMSYRRDSDFVWPYRTFTRLEPNETEQKLAENRNYAQEKERLLAWMVSHCGLLREDFVRKLMSYVKVDVFGSCAQRFGQTEACPRFNAACDNKLKRYKFVLALENSYCVDYITEKYWYTPLELGNVPIVLGGANYEKLAIPGSYINILDFSSLESLVNYLLYLDRNDTAYNEYFLWRRHYKPVPPELWTCPLCAALNNDTVPSKVYYNIDEYWGVSSSCGNGERRIQEFVGSLIKKT